MIPIGQYTPVTPLPLALVGRRIISDNFGHGMPAPVAITSRTTKHWNPAWNEIFLNSAAPKSPGVDQVAPTFGTASHDDSLTSRAILVSSAATALARHQGLWGALVLMKNLVWRIGPAISSVTISLGSDPDFEATPHILWTIRISGSVSDLLAYNERLLDLLYEEASVEAQLRFTFHFELR